MKAYPPVYVEPGVTTTLTAKDGSIEFIGIDDPKVLDFIEAMAELRILQNAAMRPSDASLAAAQRKVDRKWFQLPNRVFIAIDRRAGT